MKQHNRLATKMLWGMLCISAIASLAYFAVILSHGFIRAQQQVDHYDTTRIKVQQAVNDYAVNHNGSLPALNGTYTNSNCAACGIIDMNVLLMANGGTLQDIPASCWKGPKDSDDNCDGELDNRGCSAKSHYVWIMDGSGIVYSTCIGVDCPSNDSGCQNIWP